MGRGNNIHEFNPLEVFLICLSVGTSADSSLFIFTTHLIYLAMAPHFTGSVGFSFDGLGIPYEKTVT